MRAKILELTAENLRAELTARPELIHRTMITLRHNYRANLCYRKPARASITSDKYQFAQGIRRGKMDGVEQTWGEIASAALLGAASSLPGNNTRLFEELIGEVHCQIHAILSVWVRFVDNPYRSEIAKKGVPLAYERACRKLGIWDGGVGVWEPALDPPSVALNADQWKQDVMACPIPMPADWSPAQVLVDRVEKLTRGSLCTIRPTDYHDLGSFGEGL